MFFKKVFHGLSVEFAGMAHPTKSAIAGNADTI